MRAMKDSGVEWIGEIPQDWDRTKLLNLLRVPISDGPHETPKLINSGIPFISVDSVGNGENIDLTVCKKFISEEDYINYSKKTKIESGDILFTKAATIGKTAIVRDEIFMVWSPIAIIKTNNEIVHNKYIYYVLSSSEFIKHVSLLGSYNTQINVGMRELERAMISLPPKDKQKSIVVYLDSKCSKIDTIIEKQQAVIEKLKEYKLSVITEAVTKGLNPDVEMKDSGVEWIGEIPKHWSISHIGNLAEIGAGSTPDRNKMEYWDDGTIPWMSSGEINYEYVYGTQEYITELGLKNSSLKLLPINTVMLGLIGQGKTKGMSAILKVETTCNQNLAYLITNDKWLHYEYLFYSFKAMYMYIRGLVGESQAGIYQYFLKKQYIPLPCISEQKVICNRLNVLCKNIDAVIQSKKKKIKLLGEYKKSLIYEVVTGKKEV